MVGTRLLASTGNIQNVMKDRFTDLRDTGLSSCNGACVDINQIGPALGERRP